MDPPVSFGRVGIQLIKLGLCFTGPIPCLDCCQEGRAPVGLWLPHERPACGVARAHVKVLDPAGGAVVLATRWVVPLEADPCPFLQR